MVIDKEKGDTVDYEPVYTASHSRGNRMFTKYH